MPFLKTLKATHNKPVKFVRMDNAGENKTMQAKCEDASWNPVIYNYMWGPTEFHPTGTLLDFDISDRLHEIEVPVLFITGEFDEARPETIRKFHESVPGSKFIVVEGVGHSSYSRKPEEFRASLEDFLDWAETQQ